MSSHGTFACAINCMDGRVQDAVKKYMQDNYGVDFVDMITEPGPVKILAENSPSDLIADIKKCVSVSVEKHGSKVVAVVGHHDCAGNPVPKEDQIKQLADAKKTVESFGFGAEVVLLYVNADWQTVEKV